MIKTKKSEKANLENKKSIFFLIGLVLALGTVLLAFEWKTSESLEVMVLEKGDYAQEDFIFIPSTPAEKKEIPKPVIQVPELVLVDNNTEVAEIEIPSSEEVDEINPELYNFVFQPTENENDKEEEIINFAEIMPEFPGGERALVSFLARNVKYPLIAQENGIQGRVYVSFVVDETGNIFDAQITRGVDSSLDNEALRVVCQMPRWKPGKQGGKAVKVRYTVPINFELR